MRTLFYGSCREKKIQKWRIETKRTYTKRIDTTANGDAYAKATLNVCVWAKIYTCDTIKQILLLIRFGTQNFSPKIAEANEIMSYEIEWVRIIIIIEKYARIVNIYDDDTI